MTTMRLILQLYTSGSWWDVMHLEFEKPKLGPNSPCSFAYDLPDLLSEGGLPQQTFRHPRIALARLHPTFRAWGLA